MSEKLKSTELLRNILKDWTSLYGRELESNVYDIWVRLFCGTEVTILREALDRVTNNSVRMPTPAMVTKEINRLRETGNFPIRGEQNCRCEKCRGTGFLIIREARMFHSGARKCNCHPHHAIQEGVSLIEHDFADEQGTPCWLDVKTGELLYRGVDCPEGTEALAMLAKVAGQADLANWYVEGMRGSKPEEIGGGRKAR